METRIISGKTDHPESRRPVLDRDARFLNPARRRLKRFEEIRDHRGRGTKKLDWTLPSVVIVLHKSNWIWWKSSLTGISSAQSGVDSFFDPPRATGRASF